MPHHPAVQKGDEPKAHRPDQSLPPLYICHATPLCGKAVGQRPTAQTRMCHRYIIISILIYIYLHVCQTTTRTLHR